MEAQYRIQFTEEHLLTTLQRYREQAWWQRQLKNYWWLLAILAALAMFAVARNSLVIVLVYVGLPILMYLPLKSLNSWLVRRQFRKSPYHNDQIVITLSETGMSTVSDLGETRVGWKAFTKARQFSDGLLLFQGPHLMNWFPHTAAVDAKAAAVAADLARDRIEDFRDL